MKRWLILVVVVVAAACSSTATTTSITETTAPTPTAAGFNLAAVKANFVDECKDPTAVDDLFCEQVKVAAMMLTATSSTSLRLSIRGRQIAPTRSAANSPRRTSTAIPSRSDTR